MLVVAAPVANQTRSKNKVIIDNDFTAGQWDPYLLALNAGWDVLGLTTCKQRASPSEFQYSPRPSPDYLY
jgi:hypothetical protein